MNPKSPFTCVSVGLGRRISVNFRVQGFFVSFLLAKFLISGFFFSFSGSGQRSLCLFCPGVFLELGWGSLIWTGMYGAEFGVWRLPFRVPDSGFRVSISGRK